MKSETEERDLTKKFFLEKICSLLGGRAAEMVFADVLGSKDDGPTYGAASDLEMATSIAASMVCKLGMYEEEIGLAVMEGMEEMKLKCDEKAKELINRILSEQLKEAMRIIEANRDVMNRLVTKVMDSKQKYLTKKEIQETAGELNIMKDVKQD